MMIVIVGSGWRKHEDEDFIIREMQKLLSPLLAGGWDVFFRVGDAPGADEIMRNWLSRTMPKDHQIYRADWDKFGNYAGPHRNAEMLEGARDPHGVADFLIAFPQPWRKFYRDSGTWGCMKEAFSQGCGVKAPRYTGTLYPRPESIPPKE